MRTCLGSVPFSPRERKRVQRVPRADDDELASVEEVGFRTVARVRAEPHMPQRLAGRWIVGDEVAAAIVSEQELAGRAKQTRGRAAASAGGQRQRTAPFHLAGPVVDRLERAPE